jgi:hypothetical protein
LACRRQFRTGKSIGAIGRNGAQGSAYLVDVEQLVDPPAPSPRLLERVASMRPVGTRAPVRSLLGVAALALVWGGAAVLVRPLRQDLPWLPVGWVVTVAIVWLAAFAAPLAAALVPGRGQVLPNLERAGVSAAIAAVGVILLTSTSTVQAPGHSILPDGARALLASLLPCCGIAARIFVGVLAVAFVALRRLTPIAVGGWRAGLAVGASAGALAGLALHFVCPCAATAHVTIAHAGAVTACAAVGALLFRLA